MLENIKAVNNPLTIIALFAALAEVASVFALAYVKPELQYIFIWFVIGFPTVLVLLFFLTLNFNHKVLYAPSDFKDEQNFLEMLNMARTSKNLDEIQKTVESAKAEIENKIKSFDNTAQKQLSEIVDKQFEDVREKIVITRDEFEATQKLIRGVERLGNTIEVGRLATEIHDLLLKNKKSFTYQEIKNLFPSISEKQVKEALDYLLNTDNVIINSSSKEPKYSSIVHKLN